MIKKNFSFLFLIFLLSYNCFSTSLQVGMGFNAEKKPQESQFGYSINAGIGLSQANLPLEYFFLFSFMQLLKTEDHFPFDGFPEINTIRTGIGTKWHLNYGFYLFPQILFDFSNYDFNSLGDPNKSYRSTSIVPMVNIGKLFHISKNVGIEPEVSLGPSIILSSLNLKDTDGFLWVWQLKMDVCFSK